MVTGPLGQERDLAGPEAEREEARHRADDRYVAGGSPASQVDRSFANLISALQAAGGRTEDIVKITMLIVDHDGEKLAVVGEKRRETFGNAPPASTLIPVTRLYAPGVLFEIDAVAVKR